ncbi:hypothetical protein [Neobacillus sp. LXY-4]|uniref:hypothetical protein n=1 Tax=Neobacillus sp. LXY-4 TaxID=3379826 RepID=UPI003F4A0EC5
MIPSFILNKLISKILSLVLEKTGEDHSKLQDRLESLEKDYLVLKQSLNTTGPVEQPSITIENMTIEKISIENIYLSQQEPYEKGTSDKVDPQNKMTQSNSISPKINIRERKNQS